MHFYMKLISIYYPFVALNPGSFEPPEGQDFLVDYNDTQVVTYNGDLVTAKEV